MGTFQNMIVFKEQLTGGRPYPGIPTPEIMQPIAFHPKDSLGNGFKWVNREAKEQNLGWTAYYLCADGVQMTGIPYINNFRVAHNPHTEDVWVVFTSGHSIPTYNQGDTIILPDHYLVMKWNIDWNFPDEMNFSIDLIPEELKFIINQRIPEIVFSFTLYEPKLLNNRLETLLSAIIHQDEVLLADQRNEVGTYSPVIRNILEAEIYQYTPTYYHLIGKVICARCGKTQPNMIHVENQPYYCEKCK
jgi:hypothetical protein